MDNPVTELRVSASPGEVRVAVTRDGSLLDYAVWRPGAPDGTGDIHRGRVTSIVPAMAGAFVSLGDEDGFLPDSEGAKGLSEGTILPVIVTRAAQGGKGPRLSARLGQSVPADSVPAESVPAGPAGLVRRGPSALLELAARYQDVPVLVADTALLAMLRPILGARVSLCAVVFDDEVATDIDALEQPEVALPNGGRLSIYPTPALVAIDVDSSRMVAEGRNNSARYSTNDRDFTNNRHFAMNEAMLSGIALQIRLRNLSGAIVIDFAGMSVKRRAALGPGLAMALADDPLKPRFLGFSALGLAEIVRARRRPPLHEILAGAHAAGLAALRALVRESGGNHPVLRAAPPILTALRGDPAALEDFTRRTGKILALRDDPSMTGWSLETTHG